jgi:hypothetical protein
MGGKGSTSGVDPSIQAGELANESQLVSLAKQQAGQSQQLFNLTEPGIASAEGFYGALASGSPTAIQTAIAPAAQQINQATQGAITNIEQNAPNGGEKNLAIETAKAQAGAEIGKVATQGYLGSFNALSGIESQGVGQSQSATGLALSGLNSATQVYGQVGQQQVENSQLAIQQKGQTLGAIGGLAGDVTDLATGGIAASWGNK